MPFYSIYISYSTRHINLFKKFTCAVGSDQNVSNENLFSVSSDATVFAGKNCNFCLPSSLNFPAKTSLWSIH